MNFSKFCSVVFQNIFVIFQFYEFEENAIFRFLIWETCEDAVDWDDGFGDDCHDYKNYGFCVDCKTGPGWNITWGEIKLYNDPTVNCPLSCGCCTSIIFSYIMQSS